MAIRIESLSVENLRKFEGEHQLDFDMTGGPEIVVGNNGTGKTTLVRAIELCLTGDYDTYSQLSPLSLVNDLSTGEEAVGGVTVTVQDTAADTRYRFTRPFQTTETRRGPVDSVGSLKAVKETDEGWEDVDASKTVEAVFPPETTPFTILDAETTIGIKDPWSGTDFDELVDLVAEAATTQAVARGESVPSYAETNEQLKEALLDRINERRVGGLERYMVEVEDGELVVTNDEGDMTSYLSAAEQSLLTQNVAMAAADLLPATPPLIGDSVFGRVPKDGRQELEEHLFTPSDRQVLLFGLPLEFEDLDLSPTYRLEDNGEMASRIVRVTD